MRLYGAVVGCHVDIAVAVAVGRVVAASRETIATTSGNEEPPRGLSDQSFLGDVTARSGESTGWPEWATTDGRCRRPYASARQLTEFPFGQPVFVHMRFGG